MSTLRHLAAVIGLSIVAACPSPNSGDRNEPDRLSSGPLSLDEASISAKLDGDAVTVQVPILFDGGSANGNVEFKLVDLSGDADETLATSSSDIALTAPGTTAQATLAGVEVGSLGDLAKYVVQVVVTADGERVRSRRSLFASVPRLALQAVGSKQLAAQAEATLRGFARNASTGAVAAGVEIAFEASQGEQTHQLGSATSDDTGMVSLAADLSALAPGPFTLIMRAEAEAGQALLRVPLEVVSTKRLHLSTDKPRYQPGQTIHLRGLALAAGDRRPEAQQAVVYEIFDGAENRVHRSTETSNDFGVSSLNFRLADRVNEGNYLLRMSIGEAVVEEQVVVERYRLPRMLATFTIDQNWLRPNSTVEGQLELRYPFGQPVRGAAVELLGDAINGDEGQTVSTFNGRTDDSGRIRFSLVASGFSGAQVATGAARFQITMTAVDSAGQRLQNQRSLPVASGPARVALQPAAGRFLRSVAQPATLIVTSPGGSAIEGPLRITLPDGEQRQLTSNARGLVTFELPALANAGLLRVELLGDTQHELTLPLSPLADGIFVSPQRRFLRAGELLDVALHGSVDGRVAVDALREGRVLASATATIAAGSGTAQLQLPEGLHGGVQLRAIQRDAAGALLLGAALVHVDADRRLNVTITPSEASYRPGSNALLNIRVTDAAGQPQAAAVGLTAVDEAVFGLSPARPGASEAYFDLGLSGDRGPVAALSAEAVLMSRDEATAVPAFARLVGAARSVDQDSEVVDQADARSHLIGRVQRELDELIAHLGTRWEQGQEDWNSVRDAMKRTLVGRSDPFGRIYQSEVNGWQVVLISGGADERLGTEDDLRVTGDLSAVMPQGRGLNGDADFAEGAGGGAQAGAEPPNAEPTEDDGGGSSAPRVRSWFPETLIADPMIITNEAGEAQKGLRVADSITTWKLAAMANSAEGHVGSGAADLVVFQPFFADLDLPLSVTRGDEIEVPVIVYNYLDEAQDVALTMNPAEGLTLIGDAAQSLRLEPREVRRAAYILRADRVGEVPIQVLAEAGDEADAVRRSLHIMPDGDAEVITEGGRIGDQPRSVTMDLAEGVPGSNELLVKIYPGLATQAVEGIDSMLKMPGGCFEQTTSTAWPNIMVYQYLVSTGNEDTELQSRAVELIRAGYQRILTFESPTGGYNWWGNSDPGNRILTAIALWQFADLQGIIETDSAVADRHRAWLLEQQQSDGSWAAGDALHSGNEGLGEDVLRSTAFIAMGLHRDGGASEAVQRAVAFLRARVEATDDLYAVALAANLFSEAAADDPLLDTMLNRLNEAGQAVGEDQMKWTFTGQTWTGARGGGAPAEVEMTGLVVMAFLTAGQHTASAEAGLTFLAATKDAFGNWYSTQATMNSLRALTQAAQGATSAAIGDVEVRHGGEVVQRIHLDQNNGDVHHTIDLSTRSRGQAEQQIEIRFTGEGSLMYQVVGVRYEPWNRPPEQVGSLGLEVSYSRDRMAVGETTTVTARLTNRSADAPQDQVIVSIASAPGLTAVAADLDRIVAEGLAQRIERGDRRLTFYVMGLAPNETRTFRFAMQADRPVTGQHPPSRAYSYYNPQDGATTGTTAVVVEP